MHGGVLITWGPLGPITSHWRLISHTIYLGSSILNPIGLSDRPKDNEQQISFDHLDIGLPKALLLSGREGRLSMLFRRWLQDVLDVWLDKNLNCAFQKNIQLPLSQRRHSSSSSQLSVMQKPQKMQTQLCCFTHPPLQQDLKTQGLRHLLKAAQTLGWSLCWIRNWNSHFLCSQIFQYTLTVAGTRATQDCLTPIFCSIWFQMVSVASCSFSVPPKKHLELFPLCLSCAEQAQLPLPLPAQSPPALTTSVASAGLY